MGFIRRNKFTIVFIILFSVLVIALYKTYQILVPDENTLVYGDRLDGIEAYPISDETKNGIKEKIESHSSVKTCNVSIQGKIIYVNIEVNEDVPVEKVKGYPDEVLSFLEKEKEYYDIQLIINKKYVEFDEQKKELQTKINEYESKIQNASDEDKSTLLEEQATLQSQLDKIEESESFPVIAYKNVKSNKFSWTKDRGTGK